MVTLAAALEYACGWLTPRTEVFHDKQGLHVVVRASDVRKLGIDGFGAPHALGVLYPTIERGWKAELLVGDRPAVVIAAENTSGKPTREQLAAIAAWYEVAVAEGKQHIAYRRTGQDDWTVLHLLPVGIPFDTKQAKIRSSGEPPLSSLTSAEEIALEAMREPIEGKGPLVWQAIVAQPFGPPWDDAILDAWPFQLAHRPVLDRVRAAPPLPGRWREAALAKAKRLLRQDPKESAEVIVAFDDESETRAMDDVVLEEWPDTYKSHDVLMGRLAVAEGDRLGTTEPSEGFRKRAREKAEPLVAKALEGEPVRYSATMCAAHLLMRLERDSASCDRLRKLERIAEDRGRGEGLPPRCNQ